jgi:hypothetical protein
MEPWKGLSEMFKENKSNEYYNILYNRVISRRIDEVSITLHKNQSFSCREAEVRFEIRSSSKFILSDSVFGVGLHVIFIQSVVVFFRELSNLSSNLLG